MLVTEYMFAHTHRRSLSLLLSWTSHPAALILPAILLADTLAKNPWCMPFTRTFPELYPSLI